jgi:hypothetical protein
LGLPVLAGGPNTGRPRLFPTALAALKEYFYADYAKNHNYRR